MPFILHGPSSVKRKTRVVVLGWLSHGSPSSSMRGYISTSARWCHFAARAAYSTVVHPVQYGYYHLVLRALTPADPLNKTIHHVSLRIRTKVKRIQSSQAKEKRKIKVLQRETQCEKAVHTYLFPSYST